MHLSWDQMGQLYISPLNLLRNLTKDLFDAAISCSVRLFQHKPPKSLIVKGLLQFQKSFFCYIYQPSRRRRVFNYIIRAKRRPSPEVLPAWSCFRHATAALSCALSIGKDLMAKRVLYYQLAPLLYEPDPRNQIPPSLEWGMPYFSPGTMLQ